VTTATHQAQQTLWVKQRITLTVNQFEVRLVNDDGTMGQVVAFAEQKRLALNEQVTFYRDGSKTGVFAAFKARGVMNPEATYDVTGETGAPIGLFRKDLTPSLVRNTWHLDQPGLGTTTGRERSTMVALVRRLGWLTFWPYHFAFTRDGRPAFSVSKKFGPRYQYVVTINDLRLDPRLVIAMSVALNALRAC